MQKRKLGNSGLEVAPLAFGGNVFGWTADQATSFRLLDAFVDAGFNLIDTADIYSNWVAGNKGGESESIVGKWLKQSGKRDKVLIATKVGMQTSTGEKGLSRDHIRKSIDGSLQRLGIDSIDLYQAHQDDPDTPLEETLGAFAELMHEGKVRAIGASNYSAARLSEALAASRQHGLPRYESLQPQYNLYDRQGFEAELEPLCLREHVGVISYYSLASGFLTGKYRSEADLGSRARSGAVKGYLNDRGQKILKALDEVAGRLNASPAQVALAWLIARPSVTAPIASATSLEQLSELKAAARLELDNEAVAALNHASA
ncbi:MAG: aldo/keto reductase [Aureliella sp.]